MNTSKISYKNTDRARVLNFVQSLAPTATEQPFIQAIFDKSHISMKDTKILLEYVVRRGTKETLPADAVAALGLPSLPV